MLHILRGVNNDLIAAEAKYHKSCFASYVSKSNLKHPESEHIIREQLHGKISECRVAVQNKSVGQENVEELSLNMQEVVDLLERFKQDSRSRSKMFAFWEEYGTMVSILLQFIKAERTGNWKLHLSSTAAMLPYFFAMDRPNYARWLPV